LRRRAPRRKCTQTEFVGSFRDFIDLSALSKGPKGHTVRAMYRVIQWATGGVGRAAIQAVLHHPELELVGCWVHSADKDGRDAGELAG
jgi:hypothetical protein